jgi:hypothetical protein
VNCNACGCAVDKLPLTVDFRQRATLPDALSCPACGGVVALEALFERQGVCFRGAGAQRTIWRWTGKTQGPADQVRSGRLTILLPHVSVLDPRRVAFNAVARIIDRNGNEVLPDHPVRPEFVDLLVTYQRLPSTPGRYRCKLQLRGYGEHIADVPVQGDVEHLRVALWPKVALKGWKLFLLGGWADGLGEKVRIDAVGCDTRGPIALGPDQSRGVRQLDGRPSFVCVSIGRDNANADVGGCFAVPEPRENIATDKLKLAIDFGTSNTYLAAQTDVEGAPVREIPWVDLDLVLIDGAPRPDAVNRPETWPPVHGFDPMRSTFPSSLLTDRPAGSLPPDANGWRLGEDFGVTPPLGEMTWQEGEHLVSDLKWGPRTAIGPLPDSAARTRYLETLLLLALANLVYAPDVHFRSVDVLWSYPLVFDRSGGHRLRDQAEAFERAAAQVSRWTGLSVHVLRGMDEANAATVGNIGGEADDVLIVDVGGGTADVAFVTNPPRTAETRRRHLISSFRFAGHDFIEMLQAGRFLSSQITREQFLRRIRTHGRLNPSLARTFFGNTSPLAQQRTQMFFDYLVEYMARAITARLLDGSLRDTRRPRIYRVSALLLGNAWEFLGLARESIHDAVAARIEGRVEDLVKAEKAVNPTLVLPVDQVTITCRPTEAQHPKQVVAHGLLNGHQGNVEKGDRRGNLGVGVRVQGVTFPWHTPVVGGEWFRSDDRLARYGRMAAGGHVEFVTEDDPGFGRLPAPWEADEGLTRTYHKLVEAVLPANADWFERSSLEVALEEVIRPRLHALAHKVVL